MFCKIDKMRSKDIILVYALSMVLSACNAVDPNAISSADANRLLDKPFVYEAFESMNVKGAFLSFNERLDACQVPMSIASSLTTEALIATCVKHPLSGMYLIYEDEFEIVRILSGQNNAFRELMNRSDGPGKLVDYYASNPDISLCQRHFLELLLGSGLFPSVFNEPLSSKLRMAAASQLSYRRMMPDRYSVESRKTAELLIRELDNKTTPTLNSAGNLLKELAYSVYPIKTKQPGALLDIITVYTPFGTSMNGYVREELGSDEIAEYDLYFTNQHPNATLVEHSSKAYNCHSYAWNMMPFSGQTCWITSPDPYINDRSFVPVNSYSIADVIYSSSSNFSGTLTSTAGVVISKWENGPVMQHSLNDSPYGTISNYSYYKYDPTGQYSSWPGALSGECLAYVSNMAPYNYSYSYYYPVAPYSSFVWEVYDSHGDPGNCTITANSNNASIVFHSPGEYDVCCSYYVNGVCFVTADYAVLAVINNRNDTGEPDEEQ